MTPDPQRAPISGARRAARIAVAAGLVAALSAAGPIPLAVAAGTPAPPPPTRPTRPGPPSSPPRQAGFRRRRPARRGQGDGDKNVTHDGRHRPRADRAGRRGAGRGQGRLGGPHLRQARLRPRHRPHRARRTRRSPPPPKLSSVHGDRPAAGDRPRRPDAERGHRQGRQGRRRRTTAKTYPAPDKNTPAENPYNPSFETGAVDFVKKNPKADGRGVTIGILDSGVDLGHPALQKTTTGERKIVDWVTATDPIARQRRHLAPDGHRRLRAQLHLRRPHLDGAAPARTRSALFRESATAGGDAKGDANRDGDTTDAWGVLYDAAAGTVTRRPEQQRRLLRRHRR